MSVIRWVVRKGGSANRWLAALVARKPKMVAAVALANKMARMIWAVTTKQEDYRMVSGDTPNWPGLLPHLRLLPGATGREPSP
jgi:hypothetical protein